MVIKKKLSLLTFPKNSAKISKLCGRENFSRVLKLKILFYRRHCMTWLKRSFDIWHHFSIVLNGPNVDTRERHSVHARGDRRRPVFVLERNILVLVKSLRSKKLSNSELSKYSLTIGKGHDWSNCGAAALKSFTTAFATTLSDVPSMTLHHSNSAWITSR